LENFRYLYGLPEGINILCYEIVKFCVPPSCKALEDSRGVINSVYLYAAFLF